MTTDKPFDPLVEFAAIERLVAKLYFRFSHLFLGQPDLRDFWWEMAQQEEQHACILEACRAVIVNLSVDDLAPEINSEMVEQISQRLHSFLVQGSASLTVEEAFRIAVEIESSEIDAIYNQLVHLGGEQVSKTLGYMGVPTSDQRQQFKAALRRFCSNPELLSTAERL